MHHARTWLYLGVATTVFGCAVSPAERAAQAQRDMEQTIATYGPACEQLGYKSGTDLWRDCVLRLNTKDAYERYRMTPWTTSCFGSRGFYQCSTF